MPKLSLPWPIDLEGYRIIKPGQSLAGTHWNEREVPKSVRDRPLILRKGGRLEFIDRLKIDGLYKRLAKTKTTEKGAYDFVSTCGFLGLRPSNGRYEFVDDICQQIRVVRSLLKLKESRNWERLDLWMMDNRKAILLNPVISADDPPDLFFQPSTLIDAIYLQLFEDMSTQANLKLCERPGCVNWFKYGTGTGRRGTSQYCSPKCQNAAKYAKMKEGG